MLKEGGRRYYGMGQGNDHPAGARSAPYGWPLYILPKNILIYLWRTYTMLLEYSILNNSLFSHKALYHYLFCYSETRFSTYSVPLFVLGSYSYTSSCAYIDLIGIRISYHICNRMFLLFHFYPFLSVYVLQCLNEFYNCLV